MGFLQWHYTQGINFYLQSLSFYLKWILHYFSLMLLAKSFFSPWKKMVMEEKVGWNPNKMFQKWSYNLISRGIGAMVRLILILGGLGFLGVVGVFGGIGFLLWLILPFCGLPFYWKEKRTAGSLIQEISFKIRSTPQNTVEIIFGSDPGKFVLTHVGISLSDLGQNLQMKDKSLENFVPQKLTDLMTWFVNSFNLNEENFRLKGFGAQDLILVAQWWDQRNVNLNPFKDKKVFGRPGIGLELLFGYTPTLDKYSVDMSNPQSFSHHWIGREQIVSRIERTLTSGNCVVLVGQPGVGKRTVVLEFARRASLGLLGPDMAYNRVLELDPNLIFSESLDLNQKKVKLTELLNESGYAGNIILVIRDIQRITNSMVEGYDFTDVFEGLLDKNRLRIIAIASSTDYERFITPNLKLGKYFKAIEVTQPSKEEAMMILMAVVDDTKSKKVTVTVQALKRVIEGSDRYITEAPFPEKAIELLDQAIVLKEHTGGGVIVSADVDLVLTEKTGISFSSLTDSAKEKLSNLEEIMHKRLMGQNMAINLIAKSLRGRSIGVKKDNRPIGSFLFLGPTGVGKTETAKVLANVYFGSVENIIRFDMAEFAGREGLTRLIGSMDLNQPGLLTTEIKNHPASLLLLDEIEKAPSQVFNLFLTLLDEGAITDAFGRKINCNNLFIIATSNAEAEFIRESVSRGIEGEALQEAVLNKVQQDQLFSPEFLNRFDGVVVFEPIGGRDLVKIASKMLEELKLGLQEKSIYLEITPEACMKVAQDGYDPAFGARPMRRVIDLVLGDLIGKAVLSGEVKEGEKIKLVPGEGKEEYSLVKV